MKQRWILYLRVSTQDQSTDLQKRDLERWAKARGLHYRVLEDKASGTKHNRQGLQDMMALARQGQVQGIAVWKLDRLFRSIQGAVRTLSELTELGVAFYSHQDQVDLSTSTGRLMANMLMAIAEFEADMIRTRVKAGMRAAKARGVVLGRPTKMTPEVCDQVVHLRQSGYSLKQISKLVKPKISQALVHKILNQYGFTKVP